MREWWWQFTRRRHDYRKIWQELWPAQQAWAIANIEWCEEIARRDGGTLESATDWKRSQHVPDRRLKEIRSRFRISGLLDPRISRDDHFLRHFFWQGQEGAAVVQFGSFNEVEQAQEHGLELMRFDLDRPLAEQLRFAEEYLSEMQRHGKGKPVQWRLRRDKWALYLRALDASDAGISQAAMASVFWRSEEQSGHAARDVVRAARRVGNNFPI